jgi:hypothetical protein
MATDNLVTCIFYVSVHANERLELNYLREQFAKKKAAGGVNIFRLRKLRNQPKMKKTLIEDLKINLKKTMKTTTLMTSLMRSSSRKSSPLEPLCLLRLSEFLTKRKISSPRNIPRLMISSRESDRNSTSHSCSTLFQKRSTLSLLMLSRTSRRQLVKPLLLKVMMETAFISSTRELLTAQRYSRETPSRPTLRYTMLVTPSVSLLFSTTALELLPLLLRMLLNSGCLIEKLSTTL